MKINSKIIIEIKEFYSQFSAYLKKPSKMYDNSHKRSFFSNIGITGLQNISYNLMLLLTVPYLIRVIGPDGYSKFLFILSFINLLDVIIDFGFYFTGVRIIAGVKGEFELRKYFYSILHLKLLILVFCFFVVFFLGQFTNILKYDINYYYYGFILLLANTIGIGYYYRGLNKFKPFSIANIFMNLLMTLAVIFFIKNKSDLSLLLLVQGFSSLIPALVIFILGLSEVKKYSMLFKPDMGHINEVFHQSLPNSITRLLLSTFFIAHLFIIGQFIDGNIFSAYAVSYKVLITVNNLFSAIAIPAFSFMVSYDIRVDKERMIKYFKLITYSSLLIHIFASIILLTGDYYIFDKIIGYKQFHELYYLNFIVILFYLIPASINSNMNSLMVTLKKDYALLKNNLIGIVLFIGYLFIIQLADERARNLLIFAGLPFVTFVIVLLNYNFVKHEMLK